MPTAPTPPLDRLERDLVQRLAADTRRIDMSISLGSTFYHSRFRSACAKLRVENTTEPSLVHAAYRAAVLDLPSPPARRVQLPGHQRRVLGFIAEGLDAADVAHRTGWEKGYLLRTARALFVRLRARTPWGAVSHAWQLRLLSTEQPPTRRAAGRLSSGSTRGGSIPARPGPSGC
jgi:hypothetical protein